MEPGLAAHHGGQSLRTMFSAPKASPKLWGLAGSASLHDRELVLTVVNPHATQSRETEIAARGAIRAVVKSRYPRKNDSSAKNCRT